MYIRMMQFHYSPCIVHYSMVHSNHALCILPGRIGGKRLRKDRLDLLKDRLDLLKNCLDLSIVFFLISKRIFRNSNFKFLKHFWSDQMKFDFACFYLLFSAMYQGARSMVLGGSASYHGQLCIMHYESTPYHSARCMVNGGHTSF